MKIGILTQPLHNNYGGLLQAYALQFILKRMGHKAWTVDIPMENAKEGYYFYFINTLSIIRRFILRYLFSKPVAVRVWPTEENKRIFSQHTRRFINENIRTTSKIDGMSQLSLLKKYNFDVYIVGSDQVWRPKYSPGLPHFFLDFLDDKDPVKRITYAASFGVENWEFTPEQTDICAVLAKKFNAISVREDSAVYLCEKHLGVHATHVLDPTFLLDKGDYITLVEKDNIPEYKGALISYVLDLTPEKRKIINQASTILGLETSFINKLTTVDKKESNDCIFPPVTQWLRGFMDAEFVITDSFHGTVFSIIFNKPFLCIGNEGRGMARFVSMLKIFGLESRVITSLHEINEELIKQSINWISVNAILSKRKAEATRFLVDAMSIEGH